MRGIFPVATVSTDSSDHIRIAVSPMRVAVRGFMPLFLMAGEAAIHVSCIATLYDVVTHRPVVTGRDHTMY